MRGLGAVLAALALAAAVGCSAGPQPVARAESPRFAQVKVGMSASEVVSLAGEPASKERTDDGGTEVWYYEDGVLILREACVAFRYPASAS